MYSLSSYAFIVLGDGDGSGGGGGGDGGDGTFRFPFYTLFAFYKPYEVGA